MQPFFHLTIVFPLNVRCLFLFADSLSNLQQLNAYGNKIASLSPTTFRSWSRSLRSLNLGMNRDLTVSDGAFAQLVGLEELILDDVSGLQLSADTFASQRQTLRTLSLRSTNVGSGAATTADGGSLAPWSALRGLTALQKLALSDCSLAGAVPDFAFVDSSNLHTVDLSGNAIDSVTQRSLAGLQDCLIGISLQGNRLQTLDRCLFYQFGKIDVFQVRTICVVDK
jgi:Leucine-rich repeat (LRR) protein